MRQHRWTKRLCTLLIATSFVVVSSSIAGASRAAKEPTGEPITWKGWRYVSFPLDGTHSGHWGGANDGMIHYPIHWDTLLLIDSADRQQTQGEVYLAAPTLVFREMSPCND